MRRRLFLRALLAAGLLVPAAGVIAHTPYRQWKVLRQRFLLVHSSRTDTVSDEIAENVVDIFDDVLPQANAMVARARDEQRIASLMTTGQAVLAVLRKDRANDLYNSAGEYQDYSGEMLRSLVAIDEHILVTTDVFPRHHGWLVTSALSENSGQLDIRVMTGSMEGGMPTHQGALAFARGEPLETPE